MDSAVVRWVLCLLISAALAASLAAAQPEGFYLYLGNHPTEAGPGWHGNAQGLAHDDTHWFITQASAIWKVPVTHNLAAATLGAPGVRRRALSDYPALSRYNHFGDGEHYEFSGAGYFFVAIEGKNLSQCGAVAVFRGSDLAYLDQHCVRFAEDARREDAPWCALDPEGVLYVSTYNDASVIKRFQVDWQKLHASGELVLSPLPGLTLRSENGQPLVIDRAQGGVISPTGALLYLSAGASGFGVTTPDELPTDGIHVFDIQSGRRIQRSTDGYGHFNFEFHSGDSIWQEPEGLTIWDLEDGRAPGISGQLHVLLLDKDLLDDDTDDVYVKHYTHTIRVDRNYQGAEIGTPTHPFNTVSEAYALAWNGSQLAIRSGSYAEKLLLEKSMIIRARDGSVVIGR